MTHRRLHAWGDTLQEAFEQCAVAMFGYMTDLERVQMTQVNYIEAEGHDIESLLFHFLDELLYIFSAEPYLVAKVHLILRTFKKPLHVKPPLQMLLLLKDTCFAHVLIHLFPRGVKFSER